MHSSVFLQIPLDEGNSKLYTISTSFGRFQYKVMPYGISSAPEIFQKVINIIFQGLEDNVNVLYMEDVLVCGEILNGHNKMSQHGTCSKLQSKT